MLLPRHPRGSKLTERELLAQWTASPRGQALLNLESKELQRLLPDVFGRHVLQIGSWLGGTQLLSHAETLHRAVLGTVQGEGVGAVIEPGRLPLPEKSVDAVILPHTLEFNDSPHQVLREAARVLNDRGRLFLFGFSPWSLWALRRRLGGARNFATGARLYGAGRVSDWLQLLDFEIADLRRFGLGFPYLSPRSAGHPWSLANLLLPFTESYLLVARKRVLPVNLLGRTQRAQIRSLVGVAVPAAQRQGLDGGSESGS
ncbi:Methyltransferase domain-containing protein [Solimonas aquatica]|uniref:Methyltransferase domain-containing protein n=1 Tax=Solimonas aquatica TaxID=489703 RepID=A0A1H9ISH2_9GAMM|nr:methyltransferase domain-containing protein [Solimonas aquatica]SEQ77553.1 Methyltransferase domain-containing protein [Solimonas aquatica]